MRTRTPQVSAPAAARDRTQAAIVAPVVSTSSTSSTGPSGLVVLDLDRKPKPPQPASADVPTQVADGLEALHAITAAEGVDWPETLTVETPSEGRHLYFRAPEDLEVTSDATGRVGHQIDI